MRPIFNTCKKQEIEAAHKVYEKFTRDKEMLELYEAREKFKRDYNSILATKIEEAEKKGIRKVAKNMKSEGDDVEKIARITGLTVEEIEKL